MYTNSTEHTEEELANELVPGVNTICIYFILPMLYLARIKCELQYFYFRIIL